MLTLLLSLLLVVVLLPVPAPSSFCTSDSGLSCLALLLHLSLLPCPHLSWWAVLHNCLHHCCTDVPPLPPMLPLFLALLLSLLQLLPMFAAPPARIASSMYNCDSTAIRVAATSCLQLPPATSSSTTTPLSLWLRVNLPLPYPNPALCLQHTPGPTAEG